mmetsp:Transcript_10770/g.33468  ORF Transcript_10770/g.33468 Transcript_10770/m.33468 type:complete len:472 (+) Transcript_10770:214-1629(+)
MLLVEAQGHRHLHGATRRLVVAVTAHNAALGSVPAGRLCDEMERGPRVRELFEGRALALLVVLALLLQRLLLATNRRPGNWLDLATRLLDGGGLHQRFGRQHHKLLEGKKLAVRPVLHGCQHLIRATDDTRVEVGIDPRRAPNTRERALRDLGEEGVRVLLAALHGDLAGTLLDDDLLHAVAVDLGDETAEGVSVGHCLPHLVGGRAHGRARRQRAARGARGGAAAAGVADGAPELLAGLGPQLVGAHEHHGVGVAARHGGAGDDAGLALLRVLVELQRPQGPGDLAGHVAVVRAAVAAGVDHDLALRQHVGPGDVDDDVRALREVDHGHGVVVGGLDDGDVLVLGADELAVSLLGDLGHGAARKGKRELLGVPLERGPLQVLHHEVAGVARDAVEDDVVARAVPVAAPGEVQELAEGLLEGVPGVLVLAVAGDDLLQGLSARLVLVQHLAVEVHLLQGAGRYCVLKLHAL